MSQSSLPVNKEQAAALVALDELSDGEIAHKVGVDRRTLARWKTQGEFVAHVDSIREELKARVLAQSIASRDARVAALDDRWQRMRQVVEARAIEHAAVPGGATGLLVRQVKLVKLYSADGNDDGIDEELEPQPHGGALKRQHKSVLTSAKLSEEIAEYAVDTGLLKELREHERQAAQEVGQWSERKEVSGPDGGAIQTEDVTLSDTDRAVRILAIVQRARERAAGPADPTQPDLDATTGSAD